MLKCDIMFYHCFTITIIYQLPFCSADMFYCIALFLFVVLSEQINKFDSCGANYVEVVEDRPILSATKTYSSKNLVFRNI